MHFFKDRFTLILVFVHLFFFIIKLYFGGFYLEDSYEYQYQAENILEQGIFYSGDLQSTIETGLYTKRPPLYPIFLILSSFGLSTIIGVLFFQNILSIISILLLRKIFDHYFQPVNLKLLTVFLVTSVSQFVYTNFLMSEILLQFLVILLVFQLFKYVTTKKFKYILFYQLVITALFLTKPVFYLFVIPNLVILFFISKNYKRTLSTLTCLIPIIALIFYSIWNNQKTGSYDFSSIQNINLKDYNLRLFLTKKYGAEHAYKVNQEIIKEAANAETYKDKEQVIRKESLYHLKKDWLPYSVFHLKGVIRFFIDPGRFDIFNFFNYPKESSGLLKELNANGIKGVYNYLKTQPVLVLLLVIIVLLFNLIKFIGFCWFLIRKVQNKNPILWVMFFLVGYIALLTGPLGASRFMVPVLLFYVFFSVYGILDILKRLKSYWTRTSLMSPSS